jgi:ABC-type multidrug transport system ATPase subunit
MDVVTKKDVWKLIHKLKRNRAFILTTHQMEEAEILSDKVAIIVNGELRCVGTPLYLKNTYGDGYRVKIVTQINNITQVKFLIKQLIPSSQLIDQSAGSLVFVIPLTNTFQLIPLFKFCLMIL